MAIATEQIVTQYLADASGHMRAVSQMRTSQQAMTKAVEDTTTAQTKGANSATEFLSKWQLGFGGVKGAIDTLKGGFNELLTVQKLTTAAGAANINAMSTASAGLIERMDLLKIAAAGQTGAFKLNQAQLNTVSGAIRAFVRDGREQGDVINKVTDALAKGNGGMLDDFGIILDSTGSKVGDFNALMSALEGKANGVKGAVRTQSEEMAGLGVSFSDSMSKIKQSIGEIVVAIQPLIEGIASLTSTAAGWISNITEFTGFLGNVGSDILSGKTISDSGSKGYKFLHRNDTQFDAYNANGGGMNAFEFSDQQQANEVANVAAKAFTDKFVKGFLAPGLFDIDYGKITATRVKRSGGGRARASTERFSNADGSINDLLADDESQRRYTADAQSDADMNARDSANQAMNEQLDAAMRSLVDMRNELASVTGTKNPMESILGPIDDLHGYSKAFDMLTGSVSAAMTAWIDGTGNAGEAVRHFIADSLKGAAIEMGVMALKHGAYAIGALAIGNVPSATLHAKAAAGFAAGAIAAGVAANQLGTSAGDAARGSGGGSQPGGAPSTLNREQGQGGILIVYGDPFAKDSPRGQQRQAKRLFEIAGEGQGARSN